MFKSRGFTLVEMLIATVIAGIAVIVIVGAVAGASNNSNVSVGFNGVVETRCIGGYQFVVGAQGGARQVMDELGHGVKCQ